LRLLIGYVITPDKAGHKYGPDAPELRDKLVEMDHVLGDFITESQRLFARDHPNRNDRLWIVLTTDHGMTLSKGSLKLDDILGPGTEKELHAAMTGPVANLFIDDHSHADQLVALLRRDNRIRAWTRESLPAHW